MLTETDTFTNDDNKLLFHAKLTCTYTCIWRRAFMCCQQGWQ